MFRPRLPSPRTEFAAKHLVGDPSWFEPTGTLRQGRPEHVLRVDVQFYGHVIPAGFVFDVHSLPHILRGWQPKNPVWWIPPLGHDWLLESSAVPIFEANRLYRQAMRDIGVARHHIFAGFQGVEFGRKFFPGRITRVDPDNVELIQRVTGKFVGDRADKPAPDRSALLSAAKTLGTIALRSKGVI